MSNGTATVTRALLCDVFTVKRQSQEMWMGWGYVIEGCCNSVISCHCNKWSKHSCTLILSIFWHFHVVSNFWLKRKLPKGLNWQSWCYASITLAKYKDKLWICLQSSLRCMQQKRTPNYCTVLIHKVNISDSTKEGKQTKNTGPATVQKKHSKQCHCADKSYQK